MVEGSFESGGTIRAVDSLMFLRYHPNSVYSITISGAIGLCFYSFAAIGCYHMDPELDLDHRYSREDSISFT